MGFSEEITVLVFKGFIKVVGTLWKSRRALPQSFWKPLCDDLREILGCQTTNRLWDIGQFFNSTLMTVRYDSCNFAFMSSYSDNGPDIVLYCSMKLSFEFKDNPYVSNNLTQRVKAVEVRLRKN